MAWVRYENAKFAKLLPLRLDRSANRMSRTQFCQTLIDNPEQSFAYVLPLDADVFAIGRSIQQLGANPGMLQRKVVAVSVGKVDYADDGAPILPCLARVQEFGAAALPEVAPAADTIIEAPSVAPEQ